MTLIFLRVRSGTIIIIITIPIIIICIFICTSQQKFIFYTFARVSKIQVAAVTKRKVCLSALNLALLESNIFDKMMKQNMIN